MDTEIQLRELQYRNEILLQEIAQLKMEKEVLMDRINMLEWEKHDDEEEKFRKIKFKNIVKDIYK